MEGGQLYMHAYGKHVVDKQLQQLRQCLSWSENTIAEIENQNRQLLNACRTEPALISVLDVYEKSTI